MSSFNSDMIDSLRKFWDSGLNNIPTPLERMKAHLEGNDPYNKILKGAVQTIYGMPVFVSEDVKTEVFVPTVIDPKLIDEIRNEFNCFNLIPKIPWKGFNKQKTPLERMKDTLDKVRNR